MQAFIAAKTAGKRTFDIIWRKPKIDIDDPTASEHKLAGEIKFENVNFHYPSRPDQHVLKDFSWTFEQGKTTAIVGASGSGKSTIVQLIERFYDPTDGTILVDGKPMNSIKLRHLRSQIGYVGQEPVLFNTSIKNNILLGRPTADEKEIKEALMSTNAYDFVMKQPEGMNTEAGSGGSQLSGGEK
jgi:ATP-binding cassette subfamily B (MDR/TAP) protein 1|mmetsp:Transcript_24402/g.32670  ORF Transcript_24402/g.32670 Transcript_24402/m.32670 type:complete len:185 (+) Transcript_24402:1281-1835(+)